MMFFEMRQYSSRLFYSLFKRPRQGFAPCSVNLQLYVAVKLAKSKEPSKTLHRFHALPIPPLGRIHLLNNAEQQPRNHCSAKGIEILT